MNLAKLKQFISEVPKPVMIVAVIIFVFLILPTVVILLRPAKNKVLPPSSPISYSKEESFYNKGGNLQANKNQTETVYSLAESKLKEIELLKKQGKYFSGLDESRKKEERNELKENSENPSKELPPPSPITPTMPHMIETKPVPPPSQEENKESAHVKFAKDIYGKVLNAKYASGQVQFSKKDKTESVSANSSTSTNARSEQKVAKDLKNYFTVGQFYKAVIETTVDSESNGQVVIASLIEGLKEAKLMGEIVGVSANRLNIVFDKLVYEKTIYPVRAVAYSLDKIAGVATAIQYNLTKTLSMGALAFGQAMMDALRKDEQTQSITFWGTTVTQNKTENRFREGVLAGTSSALGEAKNDYMNYMRGKKDLIVILEKGTPIYVLFTSLGGQ